MAAESAGQCDPLPVETHGKEAALKQVQWGWAAAVVVGGRPIRRGRGQSGDFYSEVNIGCRETNRYSSNTLTPGMWGHVGACGEGFLL